MISTRQEYYDRYLALQKVGISKNLQRFCNPGRFSDVGYNMRLSAVHSSIIEGSNITMEAFENQGFAQSAKNSIERCIVADLCDAYKYAVGQPLKLAALLEAHAIATDSLIRREYRGRLRTVDAHIRNWHTSEVVYNACPAQQLESVFVDFFTCLHEAVAWAGPDEERAFFVASQAHFWLVAIHPFADGNGRLSRLLEKWLLAECLGEVAWKIPTEYMYRDRVKSYFTRLNKAGNRFDAINANKIFDFMLLLPYALTIKIKM